MTPSKSCNFFIYFLLLLWLNPFNGVIYSQETTSIKTIEKDTKKVEKKFSVKKFFHHSDSSKLAKRYIRWHKNLRNSGKKEFRVNINEDSMDLFVPKDTSQIILNKEVLGFYPHWSKNLYRYLNYSMLTTIAYFGYKVNPHSGDMECPKGSELSKLITHAKYNHDKSVLITLSLFGFDRNSLFLNNNEAGIRLINKILKELERTDADGVCIDFEGVSKSDKEVFNTFIALLGEKFKSSDKNYLLYLTVPSVDYNDYLLFDDLNDYIDQYVIMGYDYYSSTSKVSGPSAPLESDVKSPFSLTESINVYCKKKEVPREKIILALPFYANLWETKNGLKGSKVYRFIKHLTQDSAQNFLKEKQLELKHNDSILIRNDSISKSSWYSYIITPSAPSYKRQWRQLWFDTDKDMKAKMSLVDHESLNGLGIWALGYNNEHQNYWNILKEIVVKKDSSKLKPKPIKPEYKYPDTIEIVITGKNEAGLDTLPNFILAEFSKYDKSIKDLKAKDTILSERITKVEKGNYKTNNWAEFKKFLKTVNYKNSQHLVLFILAFIIIFGGVGFIISLFQPHIRIIFFSGKYLIFYVGIMMVSLMAILMNNTNSKKTMLILGFSFGVVGLFFINKILLNNYKNLP
ncbi:glycosyl hydrolase family 18 protein [Lutimonas halocynthiae]|uniref:glycosyl hydrolase family 18 protein n=1 Tax=Lutimonas halocynthiae TaxID=1446477 RepID=UPI0025B4C91B|nr:glycosyl hydrolase family 18 protein [Lutimonas halocynthiae]MDN3643608.1 glycosyl hydrolase family 18 protein [Lutimonas halocynthiae]